MWNYVRQKNKHRRFGEQSGEKVLSSFFYPFLDNRKRAFTRGYETREANQSDVETRDWENAQ